MFPTSIKNESLNKFWKAVGFLFFLLSFWGFLGGWISFCSSSVKLVIFLYIMFVCDDFGIPYTTKQTDIYSS